MMGQLLRASLMHTFGRASSRPLRTVRVRLVILVASSVGFSWLFGNVVAHIPSAPSEQPGLVCIWISVVAFIAAAASYVASSGLYSQQPDTFAKLLQTWPIKQRTRWIAYMTPRLIIALLGIVLISAPCIIVGNKMGIHPFLVVLLLLLGYILATFGLLVATKLLHLSFGSRMNTRHIKSNALSPSWWFIKKAWRSRGIRTSLAVATSLSILVSTAATYRGFNDITALSLIAALLSASFCADIRSLSRPHNPAEIAALKGMPFFMRHQSMVACLGSLAIALPFLGPVIYHGPPSIPAQVWAMAIIQVVAGLSAGILGGSALTPQARDISGQFSAVLLCIAVLFLPSYIPYVRTLSLQASMALTLLLSLVCLAISYCIEYKRNPYVWRHHV